MPLRLTPTALALALALAPIASVATDSCKEQAQQAVEVREDYKNLQDLRAAIVRGQAAAGGLSGESYARGMTHLELLRITGDQVFLYSGGAKGEKLYKKIYGACVAFEKEEADRAAKRAARAAKKVD